MVKEMKVKNKISLPNISISINANISLKLEDVDRNKEILTKLNGVYFLVRSRSNPLMRKFNPFSKNVVYIGKARKSSIFSRVKRHLQTIRCESTIGGKLATNPGAAFKRYRTTVKNDPAHHWVIVYVISEEKPYLISFAEEYLIFKYSCINGRLPEANTAK